MYIQNPIIFIMQNKHTRRRAPRPHSYGLSNHRVIRGYKGVSIGVTIYRESRSSWEGGGRRMKEREGERENERVSEGGREIYNTAITGTVHTRIIITSCMA